MRIPITSDLSFLVDGGGSVTICFNNFFRISIMSPNNATICFYASNCEIVNRFIAATLLCTDFYGHQLEITLSPSVHSRFFGQQEIIPMDVER